MDNLHDRDGAPITVEEWCELRRDPNYIHVRMTAIDDDVYVSTVWIGVDYSWGRGPLQTFETMVFGLEDGERIWRWPDVLGAELGHDAVVSEVRARV